MTDPEELRKEARQQLKADRKAIFAHVTDPDVRHLIANALEHTRRMGVAEGYARGTQPSPCEICGADSPRRPECHITVSYFPAARPATVLRERQATVTAYERLR
jgi:hypothetical protein